MTTLFKNAFMSALVLWIAICMPCTAMEEPTTGVSTDSAAALMRSLKQAHTLSIYEGLPHQENQAALFQQESQRKDSMRIAGFLFYSPAITPAEQDLTTLAQLFSEPANISAFSGEKRCGGFHPDYAIAWAHNNDNAYALICFGCGEIIYSYKDKRQRFDLVNHKAIQQHFQAYRLKRPLPNVLELVSVSLHPDSVDVAASAALRASLKASTAIQILKGLAHPKREADVFQRESKRQGIVHIAGHLFYPEKITPSEEDARHLARHLAHDQHINQFMDEKKCGGFHPDYVVSWKQEQRNLHALICFGCGEILYVDGEQQYRYDLNDKQSTKKMLNAFQLKRDE